MQCWCNYHSTFLLNSLDFPSLVELVFDTVDASVYYTNATSVYYRCPSLLPLFITTFMLYGGVPRPLTRLGRILAFRSRRHEFYGSRVYTIPFARRRRSIFEHVTHVGTTFGAPDLGPHAAG